MPRHADRNRFRREAVLVAAAVIAIVAAPWLLLYRRGPEPAAAAQHADRPNVLIVVLDAMRADHLGCYGYGRETTPLIDKLAADPDSVIYRNHYVNGAYTKPSTASLFTGLFTFQHQVLFGHEIAEVPQRPGMYPVQRLGEDADTMAERFGRLGYRTFGIVKSWHLMPQYGFAQGFDHYVGPDAIKSDYLRARETLALIEQSRVPFLGYVHQAACHHPFPPPNRHPEIMRRYGYEAGIAYDERARIEAGVDFTTPDIAHAIADGEVRLEPADVEFLNLVYDAELRAADSVMGELLKGLWESGRYDDTLIIVTADHGEELYDHEGYGHGRALWNEVIRVPLIVKFPRGWKPQRLGAEVTETTQAVDLLPTLLEFAGAPALDELPGSDIFHSTPRGFAHCQTHQEWAMVRNGYKLIDGGDRTLLFDLAADPGERDDLAAREPDRVTALREDQAALRRMAETKLLNTPIEELKMSQEQIRALRSLGYMR